MKTPEESIVDRLPILDQHEMRTALCEQNIQWARELMASPRGKVHTLNQGVYLQRVSDDSVRCVGIVDHRQALDFIASMRATLASSTPMAAIMAWLGTRRSIIRSARVLSLPFVLLRARARPLLLSSSR